MRLSGNRATAIIVAAVAIAALSGCTVAGLAVGAGATVGVAAVQERSIADAAKDTEIQLEVNSRLLQKDHVLFGKTSVTVVEGRVMLTGSLHREEMRDLAGRLAWSVPGVKTVYNELQVVPDNGEIEIGRDTWISSQLRTKILTDKQIVDINYNIDTVNGVIYLMGIAQSQAEVDRIIAYARDIPKVRHIVTHVMLKDDPRRKAS